MNSKSVYVYVKFTEDAAPVVAGRLDFFSDRVDFRYGKSWLSNPLRFAFHPDLLPLISGVFSSRTLDGALGVFRDAGPGIWGRELIKKQHGQVDPADCLILSNNLLRIGVFRFAEKPDAPFSDDLLPLQIEDVYAAIQAMENGETLTGLQASILAQGSSMDGVRPKSFVEIDGQPWIIKFPSKNDHENKAVCEMIGMGLARACGIETPETRFVPLGGKTRPLMPGARGRKMAISIKRFDVMDSIEGKANIPLMSAASAMGYVGGEAIKKDYRRIAQTLVRLSPAPQEDCLSLFKRMALNVMISNKDDHIFNQSLAMRNGGWRLSPVYDVVCGEGSRRDHAMNIGKFGATGTLANVISAADAFGLNVESASRVVDEMIGIVEKWERIADQLKVSEADICQIRWAILHKDIFDGYAPAPVSSHVAESNKPARAFRQ